MVGLIVGMEGVNVDEFVIPRTFIAIAIIIVVARLMGALFKKLRQPAVVGEIVGGILLGPTLLGQFGDADETLFPLEIRPFLKVVANLGLIIFMFIVGLELDMKLIRGKERQAGVISLSSIVLPFGLGIALAAYLHTRYGEVLLESGEINTPGLLEFSLFIGASMSVTAFPVLARILTDRGMYRTTIGALVLACAAVDDILAWTLLAIVLAVVETGKLSTDFVRVMVESIVFVAVMFLVVRPLLVKLAEAYKKAGKLTPNLMAIVLVGFLASAFITAEIGIHHIFGAFVFGAVMPREGTHALFHEILERLENVSVLLLLPVFFVATGLNVEFKDFRGSDVATLGLILLTACAGKFFGATFGARIQGISFRKAAAIGTLMNTRGLTELIILNIGREKGILNDRLFTMLVVMAVFTTIITEPVLRLFYPDRLLRKDVADAERAALGIADAYRILIPVTDIAHTGPLVDVACDLIGDESPAELVLSRFAFQSSGTELGSGFGNQLAEVAEAMEALAVFQQQASARGVRAKVVNQFSSDPTRDWIDQLESLDVDVVLIDAATAPAGFVDEVLTAAECDVLVVEGAPNGEPASVSTPGSITLLVGEGRHGNGALEVAARAARSRAVAVGVAELDPARGSRRTDSAASLLESAGVVASTGTAETLDGLVIVASERRAKDRSGGRHGGAVDTFVGSISRRVVVVHGKDGLDRPTLTDLFPAPTPTTSASSTPASTHPEGTP